MPYRRGSVIPLKATKKTPVIEHVVVSGYTRKDGTSVRQSFRTIHTTAFVDREHGWQHFGE